MGVEIIAEVSTNHGGSLDLAQEFIERFADAGASTIKFQLTRHKHLSPQDHQYDWFKGAELTAEEFAQLRDLCFLYHVGFLLTVYNPDDVPELLELGLTRVKIGSGEAHERALAYEVLDHFEEVIVSTGLTPAQRTPYWLSPHVSFLGCDTRYPADPQSWEVLRSRPELSGWSDHAKDTYDCLDAIVGGAHIIETHVCLPYQARPVQPWEKSVEDIKALRVYADQAPQRFLGRWNNGR